MMVPQGKNEPPEEIKITTTTPTQPLTFKRDPSGSYTSNQCGGVATRVYTVMRLGSRKWVVDMFLNDRPVKRYEVKTMIQGFMYAEMAEAVETARYEDAKVWSGLLA